MDYVSLSSANPQDYVSMSSVNNADPTQARSGSNLAMSDANFVHPNDKTAHKLYLFTDNASRSNREPIYIEAFLPEDFSFDLGSEWSAPFAEGTNNNIMNAVGQAMGTKFTTQGMTALFWSGSSNIDFTLPLVFTAESNYNDVQKPIRDLVKLSLPTINSWNFFSAPGPTVKNIDEIAKEGRRLIESTGKDLKTSSDPKTWSESIGNAKDLGKSALSNFGKADIYNNRIQLWIGNFMRFQSVIVKNVNQNYKTVLDKFGVPMSVTVSVTFSTHMTPSAQDFDGYFQNR